MSNITIWYDYYILTSTVHCVDPNTSIKRNDSTVAHCRQKSMQMKTYLRKVNRHSMPLDETSQSTPSLENEKLSSLTVKHKMKYSFITILTLVEWVGGIQAKLWLNKFQFDPKKKVTSVKKRKQHKGLINKMVCLGKYYYILYLPAHSRNVCTVTLSWQPLCQVILNFRLGTVSYSQYKSVCYIDD